MTATGGIPQGLQSLQDLIGQWMGQGSNPGGISVVGQETPEWEFPMGEDRIPEDIRSWFLRGDAGPSRLNEFLQKAPPEAIDRFRSAINMGLLRPKNQAAQNIAVGYGGFQAGDQTLLGPMINGMPSGMNPQYWEQFNNLINTAADYQIKLLEQMGNFNGVPTLEAQKMKEELAQGWKDRATNEFIALEQQRSNKAQEGLSQQEINNQHLQQMSSIFGGSMQTDPATGQATWKPSEEARQFDTTQSGWLNGQATLEREQQAFNQAAEVAKAASNPRDYIYAQMLSNARGGLAGQAPTNQIQQTTFGPPTVAQGAQFQAPGGQYNQMQNLETMRSMGPTPGAQGQMGQFAAAPTPQSASQPPPAGTMDFSNPTEWQQWTNAANQQWQGAQQGMGGLPSGQGWQGLLPQAGTALPGGQWGTVAGAGAQPYQFQPPSVGTMERSLTMVDDTNWTPEQRAAYQQQSQQSSAAARQAAMQQRMAAMGGDGTARLAVMPGAQSNRMAALGTANPQGSLSQQNVAATQGQPLATSAFTQSLMQNRVVPKSGALNTTGKFMTPGQIQGAFNPNKVRAQDYMKGNTSERAGFNAVGSLAGYSDDDLNDIMKSNLPKFNAPSAGRMI